MTLVMRGSMASMYLTTINRVKTLIQFFNIKFPDANPIQHHKNREFLIKQHEEIINELTQ